MNLNTLLYGYRQLSKENQLLIEKHLKMNSHIFTCLLDSGVPKYQVEGLLFRINVSFGLFLHNHIR